MNGHPSRDADGASATTGTAVIAGLVQVVAGPGGDDPAYRPFQRVGRAGCFALHLRVRFGDRVQRAGDAFRVPAAELLPDPVDLRLGLAATLAWLGGHAPKKGLGFS